MAQKNTIYAPGELDKVRSNLGVTDNAEAKRMAGILGGEVGYERTEEQETAKNKPQKARNETGDAAAGGRGKPLRRIETAEDEEALEKQTQRYMKKRYDPADDPANPLKAGYRERVRMDKLMGQMDFQIKNGGQVLYSIVCFFGEPEDTVSPQFVNRRMNEYYQRIEQMVTSLRTLLPRNNLKRNEQLKRVSPFAYTVLDTLRYWNIDEISANLTRLQAHPRNVKVRDFVEILRGIYRPLYILEDLDPDVHIKGAFKFLYKVLYLENPAEAKSKYQELIRTALFSFGIIRRDIRYQLYPLLLKLLSDRLISYEQFFIERQNRIAAFLQVTERDKIDPGKSDAEKKAMEVSGEEEEEKAENEKSEKEEVQGEKKEIKTEDVFDESGIEEPVSEEEKAKKQQAESESKAVERSFATLEALFPQAGWDRIESYPDFYPYFAGVFKFKKGFELIAPTDPLQQAVVLMRILEELFFGLRYVSFGTILGSDGGTENIADPIGKIINDWQKNFESSYEKEYLPRLDEYCHLLENTAESRTSNFARRLINELCWLRRLYFFPYYRFDSFMPPPFQKNSVTAIYPEIRRLRKYLSSVAAGIDQANRQGGAEAGVPCDGIDNPWDAYSFQIPNPVSLRLDALLPPQKRNNASLVLFSLAVTVALDHLLNDENSWGYSQKSGLLFRSENGEGIRPLFGVGKKIDAEAIFKHTLKKRQDR
jgi:hypothetical protein